MYVKNTEEIYTILLNVYCEERSEKEEAAMSWMSMDCL